MRQLQYRDIVHCTVAQGDFSHTDGDLTGFGAALFEAAQDHSPVRSTGGAGEKECKIECGFDR